MDLTFTPEQDELRAALRSLLAKKSAESDVRRAMATAAGFDRDVWRQLAGIGVQGLGIPEEYGGVGFGRRELGIVFEEAGRALLCAPLLSTLGLAAPAVLLSGDDTATDLLSGIATGETIATLAWLEDPERWTADGVALPATSGPHGWRLTGEKRYVLDGASADWFVVPARSSAGVSLFVVDRADAAVTALDTMDQTRKQAHVAFDHAPARLIGTDGDGERVLSAVLDVAMSLLASEQAGVAAAALELSVEYAKIREQFGRPIGSFQAIKHMCADMLVALESARSAAYYAAWAADSAPDELPVAASMAKAFCSEASYGIAADTIQIHGGIGFTWEHPAHLYFKRASASKVLFGLPAFHREQLITRLGY